uniref:Calcium-binding EF-hand domain-containing protein n=1 Tax=Coremiostelium polycephalum TaxID=142831 RepID=A0A1L2FV18_9MYCE|nr:calcium-binding EF-hand domain-containing protein [Coremiostelium polycephalum]
MVVEKNISNWWYFISNSCKKINDNETIPELSTLPKNDRPRIIVLGTGWASLAFLNTIDTNKYEIIVVSPRNYFLFTPMLTSATVGSVELRSIIEPIRRVLYRLTGSKSKYIEAECTMVDYTDNSITIKTSFDKSAKIPYDKLVIAIGSTPSSFGTKGVRENSVFLKEAMDALVIRQKIMNCFERANFPGNSEEDIRKQLHWVIVGGGPTAVEVCIFAGEACDYLKEDLAKAFPHLIPYARITLVQSADHLLNTYDAKISEYTENLFKHANIDYLCNSRALEVKPDRLVVRKKGSTENVEIPFGLCVWATGLYYDYFHHFCCRSNNMILMYLLNKGVGPNKLTKHLCESIPEQDNSRAIVTDPCLNVIGIPNKNVFAIGDCSTISQKILVAKMMSIFKEADTNNDDKLSVDEIRVLFNNHVDKYPQLKTYINGLDHFFTEFDSNKDGYLQFNEFQRLMAKIDSNLTTLPSTAQVANQMGIYLAKSLNKENPDTIEPFRYKHLGSFAYIVCIIPELGHHSAVADIPSAFSGGGLGIWWMYRGIYLEKQFSWKNKVLVSCVHL